jgi:prolyl-tRNA synthetase
MRQSKLFYKTQKTLSKKIEVTSHRLLTKAGFIDQLASGIYSLLPLGFLVHKKLETIIRQEMKKIDAQEVFLPALQPKSIWEKSGRWKTIDPPLFKLKDRHNKKFALGSTHEEVITQIVQKKVKSWRDLPIHLFQIQTKFRNELRFFGGLLRTREFVMKDLYSFHANQKDFESYYKKVIKSYFRIFKRCGLKPIIAEASGLGFTNKITHEFQVLTSAGEDTIIHCPKCNFAQNKEIAKVGEGEICPLCRKERLLSERGIEVGNIFPLGTKYSKDFEAFFIDKNGKKKPIIMGCYGIGLGRLMATIVEIHHDKNGIIWPREVAPYEVHLIPVEIKERTVRNVAEKIYQDLQKASIEVLYDDRKDTSIGEKFVEADLIGIPKRIVISKKTVKNNQVEMKEREKKELKFIKVKELVKILKKDKKNYD